MGITAPDINMDYTASGSAQYAQNPTAIHRGLTNVELTNPLGLYYATGGNLSTPYTTSSSGSNVITLFAQTTENTSLKNTLDYISNTFCLTKEDLAQVCRVQARKTLYNWMDGESSPRRSALERIYELYTIAEVWRTSGIELKKQDFHTPAIDDKTIVDLLSEDEIDRDLILFAGSRIQLSSSNAPVIEDPFT